MSRPEVRGIIVLETIVILWTQMAISHLNHSNAGPDVIAQYVFSDPVQSLNSRGSAKPDDSENRKSSARIYKKRQERSDQHLASRTDLQGKFSSRWESLFRESNNHKQATSQRRSTRRRYEQKEVFPLLESTYRESTIPREVSSHRESISRRQSSRRRYKQDPVSPPLESSYGESTNHGESNNPGVSSSRIQSSKRRYEQQQVSPPLESSYRESTNHRESSSRRQSSRRRDQQEPTNKESSNQKESTVRRKEGTLYENPLYALTQRDSNSDRDKQWRQTEEQRDFSNNSEQEKKRLKAEGVQSEEKAYYESGTLQMQPYNQEDLSLYRGSDAPSKTLPNMHHQNQNQKMRFAQKDQPNDQPERRLFYNRGDLQANPYNLRDRVLASSYNKWDGERRKPYDSLNSQYRKKHYDSATPFGPSHYRYDTHLAESSPQFSESHQSLPRTVGTYNPSQQQWQEGLTVSRENGHRLSHPAPMYPWHSPPHPSISSRYKSTLDHPSFLPELSEEHIPQDSGIGPPRYRHNLFHHPNRYSRRAARSVGDGCWWEMVFKAVSGNQRVVINDFLEGGNINKNQPKARDLDSALVFRDGDILDNWDLLVIEKVKIEVFDAGQRRTWFIFNGLGSTLDGWLAKDRLISSLYKNIKSGNFTFFSVAGNDSAGRTFFIQRTDSTCTGDCGYLAVADSSASEITCDWESQFDNPRFLYSRLTDSCGHYQDPEEAGDGDRLLVSVKLCHADL